MGDATPAVPMRAVWRAVALVLPAVAAAFLSIGLRRAALERRYRDALATEAKRRAIDVSVQTMSGDVMGAVSTMGLVNHPLKDDARGTVPPNGVLAMEPLRANGEARHATALYVVDREGIVRTSWYTTGQSLTGLDVGFRSYFRMAMQGRQNVSAGTSATTGTPALYVAAPLFEEVSSSALIIGAVVARLGTERIDSVLKAWPDGPALLLSPQQVAFISSRGDWAERMAADVSPEQLRAIRALRQFSPAFDERPPALLPFDVDADAASIDGHRYAVARAPVQWNDPMGEWSLVLLGDLEALMPASQRALAGILGGALMLAVSAAFLTWRGRLQLANVAREHAEAAQQAYAVKLYFDSEVKAFVAELATDLHQTESPSDFARTFMSQVTMRVAVEYGVFYVLEPEAALLRPVGGYGAVPGALESVAVGQGLVGQCARDRAPIVLTAGADTTLRIVWGGGAVVPAHVLLLPLVHEERLLGVILFASMQAVDDEQRALLDTVLPMVALNLEMLEHRLSAQHAPAS